MAWFREEEPVQTGETVTSGREGPGKYHLELQAVQLQDQVSERATLSGRW